MRFCQQKRNVNSTEREKTLIDLNKKQDVMIDIKVIRSRLYVMALVSPSICHRGFFHLGNISDRSAHIALSMEIMPLNEINQKIDLFFFLFLSGKSWKLKRPIK